MTLCSVQELALAPQMQTTPPSTAPHNRPRRRSFSNQFVHLLHLQVSKLLRFSKAESLPKQAYAYHMPKAILLFMKPPSKTRDSH